MKKGSTLFLRGVIILIVLIVLALCIFALPNMAKSMLDEFPTISYGPYFVVAFYVSVIPFFIGLGYAWKILNLIDNNTAFSETTVKTLRKIKHCAVIISAVLFANLPFMFKLADIADAPGMIILWGLFSGAPLVVAVFSALLQKLLNNAIQLQAESDLTV